MNLERALRHRAINGWHLFRGISLPLSLVMIVAMLQVDVSTPAGVSEMIAFSVRWAVPFIFVVAAASALHVLFPGPLSAWLLRNRKYIGLCFAVAMAWQGLFIALMSTVHSDHYYDEIFLLRDELEGSIGYIFLVAMVVTSFRFGRKFLTPLQWKTLHRSGVYFLWAYAFSVYWWAVSYYPDPQPIDYVYYWAGFLAFTSRIAAWGKLRLAAARRRDAEVQAPLPVRLLGVVIVAVGLALAATGRAWQEPVTAFLTAPDWSANLVLWLPYWPFEPFLPLLLIGAGTMFITASGNFGRVSAPLGAGTGAQPAE